jgi:hypothetical protein
MEKAPPGSRDQIQKNTLKLFERNFFAPDNVPSV